MSKSHYFRTRGDREFSFSIPEPTNIDSFFVFSLPKAGSTLLMSIMSDVCRAMGIPVIDLPTRLFTLGIQPAELRNDINQLWQERGYAYTGFRSFLPPMKFDFSKTKNILLIRDPRDMLVSLYFSIRYSHVVPVPEGTDHPISRQRATFQKIGINQAALKMAHAYSNYFQDYMRHLPESTTCVYRYEDIIFRKREWIEHMLDFLGLRLQARRIRVIAEKHDVRPDTENPKKHIRQVTPGNYKSHLSQATIDKLDELLRPVMRHFHYDSGISTEMGLETQRSNIQKTIGDLGSSGDNVAFLERSSYTMRQSFSRLVPYPLRWLTSFLMKNKWRINKL